jgi:hypothetical protein
LIHKLAWQCHRRLPPTTVLEPADLYQTGVLLALELLPRHVPTRGSYATLLQVSLRHRYGRLVRTEWKRVVEQAVDLLPERVSGDVERVLVEALELARAARGRSAQVAHRYARVRATLGLGKPHDPMDGLETA